MKKRILFIHHGSGLGGAPISMLYLIQNLDLALYEPVVACGFEEPRAKVFFEDNGFNPLNVFPARFLHVWPSGWWPVYKLRSLLRLLKWIFISYPKMRQDTQRVLEEVRPDLVHLNSLTIAPLAVYLGRMGIPVVLHVREAVVKGTFGIRRWWLRNLIMQHVKHTIYICKDNEDALTGSIPASSVIYNPISFDKFDKELKAEDLKKSLSIPENALVLLFPGGSSLEPKGLYTFLKALLRIRQVHKHVFTIIPKFSLSEYRDRIDSYMSNDAGYDMGELSKAIISAPFTSNVEEYYAVSDIVVAPFIVPHFSRAVIEAGAMARAVVGSRIGGIEEVVTDGVNGLLVEPDNAYDLEDKLLQLIESPLLRKKMGLRGHALAVKRYQASSHSDKVMDIYDSISS